MREYVEDAMNEEYLRLYTIGEYQSYGSLMFWGGCGVGAIGTILFGFISLWLAGGFIP